MNKVSLFQARPNLPFERGDGSKMNIQPSRWNWAWFKDNFAMHATIWIIPIGAVITYVNVTMGPATLEPIPEGYVPKEHEYHRHPIQRFFAGWVYPSYQQDYEVVLHRDWQWVSE